jgi:hypothetical protein
MKNGFLILFVLAVLFGCKKVNPVNSEPLPPSPTHPVMVYNDLRSAEVKYGQYKYLDLDNDGSFDLLFNVTLLGDPILQRDRLQFYANSGKERNLLNDAQDQSPVLNSMDPISKTHPGYTWYEISAILLAEKIITFNGNYWDGLWKNVSHKFLPVQIQKNDKLYHGWVELSFDTIKQTLILHKSGISTEEDKEVKAGY